MAPTPEEQRTEQEANRVKAELEAANKNKDAVVDRIYAELDKLMCGASDSGQFFCMEFPGRALNYRQFQYDTSSRTSVVSKPYTISEAEFRLTDDLFNVAPIVQGPSGQKVSVNYLTLLNNFVPRLADVATYVKDKAALRAWLSRDQTIMLGNEPYTGSIIELSKKLYSEFLNKKEEWEREKSNAYEACKGQEGGAASQVASGRTNGATNGAAAGATLAHPPEAGAGLEKFAKWLSTVSPVRDQQLNSLFNDAIVRGYYHEVLTCLGFLNVSSPSELLETTKQNARNSARRSLDESMDVFPVQLQPNNWFEAMAPNLTPKDLTMAQDVLLAQFKGKLDEVKRLREYLADLKSRTVSDDEIRRANELAEGGKADLRKAEVQVAQAHGAGALALFNVLLKARRGIVARAAETARGLTGAKGLTKADTDMAKELGIDEGLNAMLATYEKAQAALDAAQRVAELEARRADTMTHDYKAEIAKTEQRIKDMEGDLRYLETLVGGAYETPKGTPQEVRDLEADEQRKAEEARSRRAKALEAKKTAETDQAKRADADAAETAAQEAEAAATQAKKKADDARKAAGLSKDRVPPVMPTPVGDANAMFMDVSIAYKKDEAQGKSFAESSSSQSRFNVSGLFFSVGGQRSEASGASTVEQHALSSSFQLGFRVAKVTIDRGGWFNPALFTMSRSFYRLASAIRASPTTKPAKSDIVPPKPTGAGAATAPKRPEGLLAAYPVAFVVAKDMTLRIEDHATANVVAKAMKETSSTVGGGFLCFSASHASAGRSTAESTYHGAFDDYYYIRIPGPQIIGWILQLTDPDLAEDYKELRAEDLKAYTQDILGALSAPEADRQLPANSDAAKRSGNGKTPKEAVVVPPPTEEKRGGADLS